MNATETATGICGLTFDGHTAVSYRGGEIPLSELPAGKYLILLEGQRDFSYPRVSDRTGVIGRLKRMHAHNREQFQNGARTILVEPAEGNGTKRGEN